MSESQKYDKPIEVVKMFINKCDCRSEICNATCDDKKRILDENEDLCFDIISHIHSCKLWSHQILFIFVL